MKHRNIPCTECRKHRRKCIRNESNAICVRCERLGKLCIQPSTSTTTTTCTDIDREDVQVDDLQCQVEQLEWAIQQMEDQMKSLSCRSNNKDIVSTALTQFNNTRNASAYKDMVTELMYSWQFQIKNGTFQIETGIRNISDLLPYQQYNSIHYLSPFSSGSSSSSVTSDTTYDSAEDHLESGHFMQFGSDTIGLMPFAVKLMRICAKKNHTYPAHLLLPSSLLIDPSTVVDHLVRVYFACHHVLAPMFHEGLFMERYRQLKDPSTDLLCMSLCCFVCSAPCDHVNFTAAEKRSIADYFFVKSKSRLLDQFDEPEKRLENVMVINILAKYMHMTLKFKECKQLIGMAYQICMDLGHEYNIHKKCATMGVQHYPPNTATEYLSDNLDHVLYARHTTITLCVRHLMDYISNSVVDATCFHFPTWYYLEDEDDLVKRYVVSQNWTINLFNHPFVGGFMNEVHKIHLGLTCTLSFESIVRMEDVTREWSESLPDQLRLCSNLKNETLCKQAIDATDDYLKLMTFVQYNIFTVGIYSCLLQPIALGRENCQLLSFVQQHSLDNSLQGCRLLIYAVHQMSKASGYNPCQYNSSACMFLYHAIDVLILLSLSPNAYVSREAGILLKDLLREVYDMDYMKDHLVPLEASPIQKGKLTTDDPTSFQLEEYDKYPQPWLAMMYDASRYIVQLQK